MRAVDMFAGLGGFTEGARLAGCRVVWAANHWQAAVKCHALNHPETRHACQDLHQANWLEVPSHDLLLASPSCQGYTHARGQERAHHDAARSTAWAVVSCLECHRAPFAIVENVPAFLDWVLFPAWRLAVESLGYSVAPHVVDCADFGVPQNRVRVFVVLARSKAPLKLRLPKLAHKPIAPALDWDAGVWVPIAGHAPATIARIERARREIGPRFVAPYYGRGSGQTGRSINRPLGTVTTRDRWSLVDGQCMRMLTVEEYRAAMAFPASYHLPSVKKLAVHLLGNAVPPPVPAAIISAIRNQN